MGSSREKTPMKTPVEPPAKTPYYSANQYYRERFGHKVYKLALEAGFTCPNRDGSLGVGGCTFCLEGSGRFAAKGSLADQLEAAKALVARKIKDPNPRYIAYFQSYTNTYAPVEVLEALFRPLLREKEIVGISIGTRPDCLPPETVALLRELNLAKPVWVELGLQTIHERTAEQINRCYPYQIFLGAVQRLHKAGLETIVHLIFGLPGESREEMLQTVDEVARLPIQGVKLQVLHVLRGAALAKAYAQSNFRCLEEEEWLDLLCEIIPRLPEGMVIHRLTGDGAKRDLIAPLWTANKRAVRNHMNLVFRERGIQQESRFAIE